MPANGELDWNYYRSMAFGGLVHTKKDADGNNILDQAGNPIFEDTDSFKALVPNKSDREKIKDILKNEQYGNRKSKGKKC